MQGQAFDSVRPIHVMATLALTWLPLMTVLVRIMRSASRMEMKLDLLWRDYCARKNLG